jgi:hypothetical protein
MAAADAAQMTVDITPTEYVGRTRIGPGGFGTVVDYGLGGVLGGTMVVDPDQSGLAALVSFDLFSDLRSSANGDVVDVSSVYTSQGVSQSTLDNREPYYDVSVSESAGVFTFTSVSRNWYAPWNRYTPGIRSVLSVDLGGLLSSASGGATNLSLVASEAFYNCRAGFTVAGYWEVCDGFRGGNGSTTFAAALRDAGNAGGGGDIGSEVPLPAAAWAFLAGLGGLFAARRRKPA